MKTFNFWQRFKALPILLFIRFVWLTYHIVIFIIQLFLILPMLFSKRQYLLWAEFINQDIKNTAPGNRNLKNKTHV